MKEVRATGRAIGAWHRGTARAADLADRRSAVRNMVTCGWDGSVSGRGGEVSGHSDVDVD